MISCFYEYHYMYSYLEMFVFKHLTKCVHDSIVNSRVFPTTYGNEIAEKTQVWKNSIAEMFCNRFLFCILHNMLFTYRFIVI